MTGRADLLRALEAAGPKPQPKAEREDKKNYAQRLSNTLAQTVADALRSDFPTVTPTITGGEQEAAIPVVGGEKRLDVKVVDAALGLLVSVSIKTYSFQDYDKKNDKLTRWTKNVRRNDHELGGEAMVLHQRQPYAVLIAVMFAPYEMCNDGDASKLSDRAKSSFAHAATLLRKRSGRGRRPVIGAGEKAWVDLGADDPRQQLFERVFIALYESKGPHRGAVRFFDVETPPPRNGRPSPDTTISMDEFVANIASEVSHRNQSAPTWADVPESDGDG